MFKEVWACGDIPDRAREEARSAGRGKDKTLLTTFDDVYKDNFAAPLSVKISESPEKMIHASSLTRGAWVRMRNT